MANDPASANSTAEMEAQPVKHVYCNGFDIGISLSDVGALLMIDGQPQVRVSMSFTTAKSLKRELERAISALEDTTQHSIMTMDEVLAAHEKRQPK